MPSYNQHHDSNQQQRIHTKKKTFFICLFILFSKKISTKSQISLNNSSSPPPPVTIQTKSHSMIDENTRPFTINTHQHLFNTTRERDCDEYHYRSSRDNETDDINEIYRATLRDLDTERDKRWRAEQEIKHLNDIINEFKKRSLFYFISSKRNN
jgi:hypothetical protein